MVQYQDNEILKQMARPNIIEEYQQQINLNNL